MRRLILILATTALSLFGLQFLVKGQILFEPQKQIQISPLTKYPGFGYNPGTEEARFNREATARERLIAECMQQKGFPYNISTVNTENTATPEQGAVAVEDPNVSHAESLSPEQRKEYYIALYGVPDPNASNVDQLYDFNSPGGGGCQGKAFSTITGVFAASSALKEQYLDLQSSVQEDSRVKRAEQRWSACIRGRGHQYAKPRDLRAALDTEEAQSRFTSRTQQATAAGNICSQEVALDDTIVQVRTEKEADFVVKNKDFLEQHIKRLRTEEALLNQIIIKSR
ncbi:hypothetical protein [Synechocystis sp. PCC 7509]|uniref:hypothetical protein n=1 Tax=Synechocystis sp. PCC 7509 TaxID=927677 RepID=UPI0002ABB043|nr:hypothetical protein [Synechocystis sp. PCC 7509]